MRKAGRDSMRGEYRLDYKKARPNRFSGRTIDDRVVVLLDPDVSEVFRTPEDVNGILRALIDKMPRRARRRASAG